ncbi:hypothetical protein WH8501_25920 [Crocosphaera watsonii WH 8501]|uniref:Uncharacterized protein n=1 Tax=Crocosphaera watsonii WH 8501 TaxID=165597 RepID=Q4C4A0_CROWT|nr:hypothetical protein CwatDRAFT_3999 [Crocosphaera watsonii WH 8501]
MKNIKLDELTKEALLTQKEPISIEHNGKFVGYYYPAIDHDKVKVAKEKLDTIMEKVLAKTGLTEDEYLSMFMNVQENSYL